MELLWNRYTQLMDQDFGSDLSDFRFLVIDENDEKHYISVHKRLLAMLSTKFKALFDGEWNGLALVVIDEPYEAFNTFCQCFYKNDEVVTVENVVSLKELAVKYDYRALLTVCKNVIQQKLSVDNAVDLITCTGPTYSWELVNDFISIHTEGVLKSECFLRCSEENLAAILKMKRKSCSEIKVFDACIEWARRRCTEQGIDATNMDNVRVQLGDNYKLIRFDEIDYWDLKNRWKQFELKFFTRDEIYELFVADSGDENVAADENVEPTPKKRAIIKRKVNFIFNDLGPRNINGKAEHSIRFSVSKNLRLTQIVVSNISVNVRKTIAIPSTVKLEMKSVNDGKQVYKTTEKFKVMKFQLLKVDHQKGILLQMGEVYELNASVEPTEPNNQRQFIRAHAVKSQTENNIKLKIHATDNSDNDIGGYGIISELVFENFEK